MRAAINASAWRWPALVSLGALIAFGAYFSAEGDNDIHFGNVSVMYSSALCIFAATLAATLPVWVWVAREAWRGRPRPARIKQFGVATGLLILALVAVPRFEIEYRVYETLSDTERRDDTTKWIKRSLLESYRMPFLQLDELDWLQSNFSAAYIPARVFCPLRSTRLVPLFGVARMYNDANALAGGEPPPPAVLAKTIARCDREGPAMLARGFTKESALMRGDVDRFFALNALERKPYSNSSNTRIVLEDGAIPKDLLAKIEATLAAPGALNGVPSPSASDVPVQDSPAYLEDVYHDTEPGRLRRLRPLVLAVALGRTADVARLQVED